MLVVVVLVWLVERLVDVLEVEDVEIVEVEEDEFEIEELVEVDELAVEFTEELVDLEIEVELEFEVEELLVSTEEELELVDVDAEFETVKTSPPQRERGENEDAVRLPFELYALIVALSGSEYEPTRIVALPFEPTDEVAMTPPSEFTSLTDPRGEAPVTVIEAREFA